MEETIILQLGATYIQSIFITWLAVIFFLLTGVYLGSAIHVIYPFTEEYRSFYTLLNSITRDNCIILCKVSAKEILKVHWSGIQPRWLEKIIFDFALYNKNLTKCYCAIILSDSFDETESSQYILIEKIRYYCDKANFSILVYSSKSTSNIRYLRQEILTMIGVIPSFYEQNTVGNVHIISKDEQNITPTQDDLTESYKDEQLSAYDTDESLLPDDENNELPDDTIQDEIEPKDNTSEDMHRSDNLETTETHDNEKHFGELFSDNHLPIPEKTPPFAPLDDEENYAVPPENSSYIQHQNANDTMPENHENNLLDDIENPNQDFLSEPRQKQQTNLPPESNPDEENPLS